MALDFNPPDWIVRDYYNRKQPAEIASEGIKNALSEWVQYKSRQGERQRQAFMDILALLQTDPELLKSPLGQRLMRSSPNALSGYAPPASRVDSPAAAAEETPPGANTLITSALPSAGEIKAKVAALQGRGKLGEKAIDQLKTGIEMEKLMQGLGPRRYIPREELAGRGYTLQAGEELLPPSMMEESRLRREALGEERQSRAEERRQSRYRNYFLDLEQRDPIVREVRKQGLSLNVVDSLTDLVKQGNTVAFSGLGTKMARGMGEVGVLTETDVKRYVRSGQITQKAGDTLSSWIKGRPTEATQAELKDIVKAMRQSFEDNLQPRYDQFIDAYSKIEKMAPEQFAAELSLSYSGKKNKNAKGTLGDKTSQGIIDPLGIR